MATDEGSLGVIALLGTSLLPIGLAEGALLIELWGPIAIECSAHPWFTMDLVAVTE